MNRQLAISLMIFIAVVGLSLGAAIGILIGHYEAPTEAPETRGSVFLPEQGDDSGN